MIMMMMLMMILHGLVDHWLPCWLLQALGILTDVPSHRRHLLMLPETLKDVEETLYPHKLCDYLFELSQKFNQFYENCPVSQAETEDLKRSRASLCSVSASAIRLSLGILGIPTVERL